MSTAHINDEMSFNDDTPHKSDSDANLSKKERLKLIGKSLLVLFGVGGVALWWWWKKSDNDEPLPDIGYSNNQDTQGSFPDTKHVDGSSQVNTQTFSLTTQHLENSSQPSTQETLGDVKRSDGTSITLCSNQENEARLAKAHKIVDKEFSRRLSVCRREFLLSFFSSRADATHFNALLQEAGIHDSCLDWGATTYLSAFAEKLTNEQLEELDKLSDTLSAAFATRWENKPVRCKLTDLCLSVKESKE